MRKKLFVLSAAIVLMLTVSCEDNLNEVTPEQIIEVSSETDQGDLEPIDDLPGERKNGSNGND